MIIWSRNILLILLIISYMCPHLHYSLSTNFCRNPLFFQKSYLIVFIFYSKKLLLFPWLHQYGTRCDLGTSFFSAKFLFEYHFMTYHWYFLSTFSTLPNRGCLFFYFFHKTKPLFASYSLFLFQVSICSTVVPAFPSHAYSIGLQSTLI